MLHCCLLLPAAHNISTRFLFHFSLRRWRRRNRALWRSVHECMGLVFQTGSAGWATPYSEGQNPVCNGGWPGSLEADLLCAPWTLPLLQLCLPYSLDVLCRRVVLTCRPVWVLLLIVPVLCSNVASLFLCFELYSRYVFICLGVIDYFSCLDCWDTIIMLYWLYLLNRVSSRLFELWLRHNILTSSQLQSDIWSHTCSSALL